MSVSDDFQRHVDALYERALSGDQLAMQSLCCIALLATGWRCGDPDPGGDDDPGGGCDIVRLSDYRTAAPVLRLVMPAAGVA